MNEKIRVLIVEDSLSIRLLLQKILETDPQIKVIRMLESGEAAIEYLKKNSDQVDIVTMDIIMPGMNGFKTTRYIMENTPKPIVIVSAAYKTNEAENSFKAMEVGAVAIIEKPVALTHPDYRRISSELIETIKLMSEIKVVKRWKKKKKKKSVQIPSHISKISANGEAKNFQLLVIGASTGGPPALKTFLSNLPQNFPLPILIVQHIGNGFLPGMANWLATCTGFSVSIPKNRERCKPGHIYLAPDHYQMGITHGLRIQLMNSPPENGHQPSISYLFRSSHVNFPNQCIAILFSGMGKDGALELKQLKDSGSITMVQDEDTCVVYGIPGEAAKMDAAHFILPPDRIAEVTIKLVDFILS